MKRAKHKKLSKYVRISDPGPAGPWNAWYVFFLIRNKQRGKTLPLYFMFAFFKSTESIIIIHLCFEYLQCLSNSIKGTRRLKYCVLWNRFYTATPIPWSGMVSSAVAASVLQSSADCKSMKTVNKRGWASEVGTIYGAFWYRMVDVC